MTKQNHSGRNFAIGALIAGAAGYVTGILTAPKSGKQTRDDMVEKAEDMKLGAQEQMENAQAEVNELLQTAKKKTLALSGKAREEFNEAVVKAKDAQNKGTAVLKAVRSGEAADPELNKAIKQLKQAQKNLAKYLKT